MFDDLLGSNKQESPIAQSIKDIISYITRNFSEQPEILIKKLIHDEVLSIILKNRKHLNFNVLYLNFGVVKENETYTIHGINKQTEELFEKIGL